ncbi:MAG: lysophospholipid acyltransferase family protein [Bacteroidales bacterium]|nr:lysophospholipid acyltransferase family protein [Bacteroidales bacterium]
MKLFGFYIVKLWADFLSVHPFWLLYMKSDVYRFLLYHVLRYRRKVVRENLLRSFPGKDAKAIKTIERRFYRNLCDQFVEAPKMLRMGPTGYRNRVTFSNPELAQQLYEQKKNVFYAIPHSGNWEWFGKLIPELSPHKGLAIYKKVQNSAFERLMLEMRTKDCQLEMVESNFALKRLAQLRGELNSVLMMADQSPRGVDSDYWTEFLHQDTCWFTGLERISKMLDYAVVFVDMKRVGRGRYEVGFELLASDPKAMGKNELMERYVRRVEQFILGEPDNWLWSHRRWKHSRNQNVER